MGLIPTRSCSLLSFYSPMAAPPRILFAGDVFGRLNQLFKRVQSVNKSAGPFDALFCVGQFFPDSPERLEEFTNYVEGRSSVPLPTYFIGDYGVAAPKVLSTASKNSANLGFKMDGLTVCENLHWLRGSGKFSFHGLSIVYLSGRSSSEGQQFGTYSQDDVDALRALAEESGVVDLFLTNEWPSGVANRASLADVPAEVSDSSGCDPTISELVAEIKPRYHIAGTKDIFYAREPYSNTDAVHVTRFLGLASVGNPKKQKFIHAISPTPASTMSASEISVKPSNATSSPYTFEEQTGRLKESTKRPGDSMSDSQYWRYDVSKKRQKSGDGGENKLCFKFIYTGSCPRGEQCGFQHDMDSREQFLRGVCLDLLLKGKCEKGPECSFKHELQNEAENRPRRRVGSGSMNANRSKECWFCLSSPNVESYLIISVGENYYCTLAKGPLVEDHVLVIPIEHLPNTFSLSQEFESELIRLRDSLQLYFKNQQKEAVLFEWVSKRVSHANLQVVPVPSSRAAAVPDIFNMAAKRMGFELVSKKFDNILDRRKWLRAQFDENSNFFYAEVPDGTILTLSVDEKEKFPAQFGREVLAGLLNMPDRADWRNCSLSKEEETSAVEKFKEGFKELDPN